MSSEIKDILNDQAKKINESHGTHLTNKLYQIQISLMAFEKNYKDLEKSLVDYSNPHISSKLWELGHKERARLYLWNVSRYLQNFLSSASTFRDHIRYLTQKIFDKNEFIQEYEDQILKRFSEDPLSNFIMKFRNNYLHTCVAATFASFDLDIANSKIYSEIYIDKNQLLDIYNEWNSKSKEYINSLTDKTPLLNIVKAYYEIVLNFYKWYEQRFFQIYKVEFEELDTLKKHYIYLQKSFFNKGSV